MYLYITIVKSATVKFSSAFPMMKALISSLIISTFVFEHPQTARACTRLVYETGNKTFVTGRSMDWMDVSAKTALWAFPRGMKRDGTVGANPIKWRAKYGSIAVSFYDAGTADGMNEKGLSRTFFI
jgi:choloylglycine hydrolase